MYPPSTRRPRKGASSHVDTSRGMSQVRRSNLGRDGDVEHPTAITEV